MDIQIHWMISNELPNFVEEWGCEDIYKFQFKVLDTSFLVALSDGFVAFWKRINYRLKSDCDKSKEYFSQKYSFQSILSFQLPWGNILLIPRLLPSVKYSSFLYLIINCKYFLSRPLTVVHYIYNKLDSINSNRIKTHI